MNEAIVNEVRTRCILMCGQEAQDLGLPKEAGYTVHLGIVQCDVEDWSEETYLNWVDNLLNTYGEENETKLLELYGRCADTMERYGNLFTQIETCLT